jgi:hypothetical protein
VGLSAVRANRNPAMMAISIPKIEILFAVAPNLTSQLEIVLEIA